MTSKRTSFLHNWSEIGGSDLLVREQGSGIQGERRVITLDPIYDPRNQQAIYAARKSTKFPYVTAFGSEILKLEKPVSVNPTQKGKKQQADPYSHIAVITQRIPYRLSDAPQLTYSETLYILDQSLQGFQGCYQKCGAMRISDRMIGFNNDGHCKIWVNEDFANNHPSFPRRKLMSTRVDAYDVLNGRNNQVKAVPVDEAQMVQDVVDVVEKYCEVGVFPEPFSTQIHRRGLGFAEARRIVRENIDHENILVPDHIDLVKNTVRGIRRVKSSPAFKTQMQQKTESKTFVQAPMVTEFRPEISMKRTIYRFIYLPVTELFKPSIFASTVNLSTCSI